MTTLQAVRSWFMTSSVAARLPGGLWTGIAPEGTARPYAVVNLVASVPRFNMSGVYWEADHIRFGIFADYAETARSIGVDLKWAFERSSMSTTGYSVFAIRLISKNLIAERREWLETASVWQQSLDFRIFLNKSLS